MGYGMVYHFVRLMRCIIEMLTHYMHVALRACYADTRKDE